MDTVYAVIHDEYMFIAHILIYILHKYWMRNSISPYLSMMYVTVYNMSFNNNCRILAAELNYRFTQLKYLATLFFSLHFYPTLFIYRYTFRNIYLCWHFIASSFTL